MSVKKPPPASGLFPAARERASKLAEARRNVSPTPAQVAAGTVPAAQRSAPPPPKPASSSNSEPSEDSGSYTARVTATENRKESIDSDKEVVLFKVEVGKGGQTWTVFRRFAQFEKLDSKLKSKNLLNRFENIFPKKTAAEANIAPLQTYLQTVMGNPSISSSPYLHNFLEPIQMGDTKPK